MKNIGLIGLGPHAKRIYYPFLEKYGLQQKINFICLVELRSEKDNVYKFLNEQTIQPQKLFFVETSCASQDFLDDNIARFLTGIEATCGLDGIIISSHPKSHKAYLKWAIAHNIDVLVDKPILYPDLTNNPLVELQEIEQEFAELIELYRHSTSNVVVQVQRRAHQGYVHIYRYLKDFLREFQVPISYIDIAHADGMWVMPNEWERENHPYKYGTGKLMHSGYHFVDMLAWLMDLSQAESKQAADELDVFVQSFQPSDFMAQLQPHHYERFFQQDLSQHFSSERIEALKHYGEMDLFVLAQFRQKDAVLTTTYLNLQQNSFSRRASPSLPADIYKGNGRIRHERVNIKVSTLLNVQVHSYQSHQIREHSSLDYGEGHLNHFDILFFRNSDLVGGEAFEKIEIGNQHNQAIAQMDTSFSHNEASRERLFLDFLQGTKSDADLLRQALTVQLVVKIYQCAALARLGKAPHQRVSLERH
ncbi:MAG: hypothetical protein AAGD25_11385 [Cyanobacteria bacterium P01_F01_bin.150]